MTDTEILRYLETDLTDWIVCLNYNISEHSFLGVLQNFVVKDDWKTEKRIIKGILSDISDLKKKMRASEVLDALRTDLLDKEDNMGLEGKEFIATYILEKIRGMR